MSWSESLSIFKGRGVKVFWGVGSLLACAIGIAASSASLAKGIDLAERVRPDPATVVGTLPNGLTYAIRRQPNHQKEVLNLYIKAGSLEEGETEQGLAHFLEHMAFRGSSHFPADSLTATFETMGMNWGRDQNAFTTAFSTTFVLNIPHETPEKLDLGLRWLRDVADGLSLSPDQTDRERPVVLAEYRQGLGPAKTLSEKVQAFLVPGLRAVHRPPIGQPDMIAKIAAADLRAFYQRWYRPDNAIIVAVGQEPIAEMKARILKTFGDWKAQDPAAAPAAMGAVDFTRPTEIASFSDPSFTGALSVCRYSPKAPQGPETLSVTRERLADQIWQAAFSDRMARAAREPQAPFISLNGGYGEAYRAVGQTCFSVVERLDSWSSALPALASEIRRLATYGLTQKEFDTAKLRIVAADKAGTASWSTTSPEALTKLILENLIEGGTIDSAAEQQRVDRLALATLSRNDILAQIRKRWYGASSPLIYQIGPAPVAPEEIATAWASALAAPPPSEPSDREEHPWSYGFAARPGKIVSRQEVPDPAFVRYVFANGLVLNFKHTAFDKARVFIETTFGAGQTEVEPEGVFATRVGGNLLLAGGFKNNDLNDLNDLCQGHECNAVLNVQRDQFAISQRSRSSDLGLELQILNGLVSEPGFRPTMLQAWPTAVAAFFRQIRVSPGAAAAFALQDALPKPHVVDLPSAEAMNRISLADFERLLGTPLTRDPLEVTIIGDVDEKSAVDLVAQTLGAAPQRGGTGAARPDAVAVRFDAVAPPVIHATHEGPKEQAVVLMQWPLFFWTPERQHESRVLSVLAAIFRNAALEDLRVRLGKTYGANVAVELSRVDQGVMGFSAITTPEAASLVQTEVLRLAHDLARGRISDTALAAAKTPMVEATAAERSYNSWWLSAISASARRPDKLEAARSHAADLASVTLDEVKAEAAKWLAITPYQVVATPLGLAPNPIAETPKPHEN